MSQRSSGKQFYGSVSRKVLLSFVAVIFVLAAVSFYPTRAFREPVDLHRTIMDNITIATDTLDLCFAMQKNLKDVLREYTRNPLVFEDEQIRLRLQDDINTINHNISVIKENHALFNVSNDEGALRALHAYERMLHTYIEKAEVIIKDKVSIGERSENYEMLLVYKDAIERGNFNYIAAETEYSKTVRVKIDHLTKSINTMSLLFSLTAITISIFIAVFVTSSISLPIKKITENVEQISQGNLEVIDIDINTHDELSRLATFLNSMVQRIKGLMNQIVQEQEQKRKAELEMLQGQIHPHFLYNTLDSVVRMIGRGKDEDIALVITSLSKLFRISLSRGSIIIPVAQELEHIRNYLNIQSVRFSKRFSFEIISDENTKELYTLKLLLQPIVENAINHGVEKLFEKGNVVVSAKREADRLIFEVKDNGLGISEEIMKDIFQKKEERKMGSGIALPNVKERIKLYYGEEGKIEITSVVDEGTTVRIELPASCEPFAH